jgi:hypothetical protein
LKIGKVEGRSVVEGVEEELREQRGESRAGEGPYKY